ncbi:NAD(P)-dependent alcohol dehydrogenase [Actinoplanes sp. NBRC 101535]|uniref:NAD(P)-dependent alcohol dehydrogenase n=1 Tax=Actinoplanes sp. NBRC 101535 TaxID=3032196 RepID=UPI00249FEEF1|nr:NAD(P)-dependent alcohol dehydrogenase [Actinoplanes sp. NBRC 101535]GLY08174.1 zinc-binding alcohol dehydrogenase [Actinoplanes sp. NBRC 101535]
MLIEAALVESPGGPFTPREVEIEAPRSDEVLVRLAAAGICHTDLTMRRSWRPALLPMVFGHEGAGVVEAVGSGVTTVAPGDPVCLTFRSCGTCPQCRGGHPAYCLRSDLNMRGVRADGSSPLSRDGSTVFGNFFGQSSFATFALAYERNTVPLTAGISPVLAAPLGCGVQTGAGTVLNTLDAEPGMSLIVFGAGGVGLSAVMAAVAVGCAVIVVDPVPARRTLACELGAADALDPATPGLVRELRRLTGGGAHHAIDTTGRGEVIGQAVGTVRRRGTLALVGMGGRAEVDIMTVLTNGIRVRGVVEGDAVPSDFLPKLIDLHRRGLLPVQRLVTEYPFAEIETAARDAAAGRVIKPVLTFG